MTDLSSEVFSFQAWVIIGLDTGLELVSSNVRW